ncbi:UDP-N-acetylmuramate dehydrogenase [Naasia sp. SYSU D00057]|uniref:UDP-N-acetylmuramate dehydrogenase n=1 Tax=Naasia sp. SYSU D00057 TaxID=2817380 RepID=UPI001B30D881|nr:UDP-N-acetylmuramate dehydrogenase [Naasia sp. SYSU D00057]
MSLSSASSEETDVPLSALTTLRVGGPARRLVRAGTTDDLVETALALWGEGEDVLVVGGGSNLVAGDDGVDATVLVPSARGIEDLSGAPAGRVRLRVEAGEPWDDLVAYCVERGLAGIEALSGIPGSTGAAPIQNIGAYGQEVGTSVVAVHFLDYLTGDLMRLPVAELGLGYRTSIFKRGRQGIVTAVEFELDAPTAGGAPLSSPIAYAQLASALGVPLGDRVPLAELREAVLALRRSKGMVLDPADADSVSAGSFFTNPVVTERFARTLPEAAPRWPTSGEDADTIASLGEPIPAPAEHEHRVKLSAAWLIEHAGIPRGYTLPGSKASISTKHSLAIVNRGGATAEEIAELARFVRALVQTEYGVLLQPEPVLVGGVRI